MSDKTFGVMILPENGLSHFMAQAANHVILTEQQEIALIGQLDAAWPNRHTDEGWRKVPPGAQSIINQIVLYNVRLVISVAQSYRGRGLPFDDLIQEGYMGLVRGIIKFEANREVRISTYVTHWIRQAVDRAVMMQHRTIRTPIHYQYRYQQIKQAINEFGGEDYTLAEIAERLDLTESQVKDTLKLMHSTNALSLDEPAGDGDEPDFTLADTIAGNELAPLEDCALSQLGERLDDLLDTLTPREAKVLRCRFGLVDGHPQTLGEVGEKFGLTRERIRQIEADALRKLRHPRRARRLKEFV